MSSLRGIALVVAAAAGWAGCGRGSRVDLTVAFLSLGDGAASWSAHAERRADVRRPAHAAALFRSLLAPRRGS